MIVQRNILIDDERTALISDFGLSDLSKMWSAVSMDTMSPYGENERYNAYEIFPSRNNRDPKPSYESDVYSLGCVIHEVRPTGWHISREPRITNIHSSSTASAPSMSLRHFTTSWTRSRTGNCLHTDLKIYEGKHNPSYGIFWSHVGNSTLWSVLQRN
jgi:serine/threonine protein kinase